MSKRSKTDKLIAKYNQIKKEIDIKSKKRTKHNKNINKVKSHDFTQGNYKIIWQKQRGCLGLCSDPKDRKIWIDPTLNDEDLLRTLIDESIHASVWALDNDYVGEMSDSIASLLCQVGFKLEKKPD